MRGIRGCERCFWINRILRIRWRLILAKVWGLSRFRSWRCLIFQGWINRLLRINLRRLKKGKRIIRLLLPITQAFNPNDPKPENPNIKNSPNPPSNENPEPTKTQSSALNSPTTPPAPTNARNAPPLQSSPLTSPTPFKNSPRCKWSSSTIASEVQALVTSSLSPLLESTAMMWGGARIYWAPMRTC